MAMTPHQLWNNACKYDGLSPKSTFASFSSSNPWSKRYDKVAPFLISVGLGKKKGRGKRGTWGGGEDIRQTIYDPYNEMVKLGEMSYYPMPEGITCPGKTEYCSGVDKETGKKTGVCYAARGHFDMERKKHMRLYGTFEGTAPFRNLRASKSPDFVPVMIERIKRKLDNAAKGGRTDIQLYRPNPTGDLYSVENIKKWEQIAEGVPEMQFGFYTRSWTKPEYREALLDLAKEKNVRLNLSTDPSMYDKPELLEWLKKSGLPECGIGGGFIGGGKVCTCEGNKTCAQCKHCYKGGRGTYIIPHSLKKSDLPMVTGFETRAENSGLWLPIPKGGHQLGGRGGRSDAKENRDKIHGAWAKHKSKRTTSKVSRIR